MTTTPRSLLVGVAAWCVAFLIAYCGGVNPVHLGHWGAPALFLSIVIGYIATLLLRRRFCRYDFERANAVMVFSIAYCVGILMPITAIWSNASLFAYSVAHTTKPPVHDWQDLLVASVEQTAITHLLGAFVIVGFGYILARRLSVRQSVHIWWRGPLRWCDWTFGALVLLAGLILAFETRLNLPVQWFGCGCAAFLGCFVFKSFRLQWSGLEARLPAPSNYSVGRLPAWICLGGTLLCYLFLFLVGAWHGLHAPLDVEVASVIVAVAMLIPLVLFRCAAPRQDRATARRSAILGACAMRFGFWTGLSGLFAFSGLILAGIAEHQLAAAHTAATPFSLLVIALGPLFCIAALPSLGMWLGGFVIAWFPRSACASERILACGQGGVVTSVAQSLLIYVALSLALCTVTSIPVGKPPSIETQKLLGDGEWLRLTRLYVISLAAMAASGWFMWASQAATVCLIIFTKDWWSRLQSPATGMLPPQLPTKNPPPAPSA